MKLPGPSLLRNNPANCRFVLKMFFSALVATGVLLAGAPANAAKVESAGNASVYGQPDQLSVASGIAAMTSRSDGAGYWIATSEGTVLKFGAASHFGDMSAVTLNKPVVGMASTKTGNGYWLVASDGGIFSFGDAVFYGSTGALALNSPIVDMTASTTGAGYWLVAADGGVFSFGDAVFYGSTGNLVLNRPIVGMLSTKSSLGYWLLADDGGIFTFGDAGFYGSGPGKGFTDPFAGMIPTVDGNGYSLVHSNGRITAFGSSTLVQAASCDPWPVSDMSVSGAGAVLLRTAAKVPRGLPSKHSAVLDANYIQKLISHSQACQTYQPPQLQSLGSPLLEPVKTSGYGWRRHPIWGELSVHHGVDFIGPNRTSGGAALAVASGTVMAVSDLTAYGTTIIVDHGEQIASVYGHLKEATVEPGQEVGVGASLGVVGSTGLSTGAHLHMELWLNGATVDPLLYLMMP